MATKRTKLGIQDISYKSCSYMGCNLWDVPHDHAIEPGDLVEWRDDDGEVRGRGRVLKCFIEDRWAQYEIGNCEHRVRRDRVTRVYAD